MEQEQDPQNQRNLSAQKPARELKVEDALLYLDQVKMEFSDKPQIYNEFLDIMKNFKAQSINTPGVIERVKNLFRGYNKLILGFNTFLPEGEGYKIELTAEEQAFNHPGQEVNVPPSNASTSAQSGAPSMGPGFGIGQAPHLPGNPMSGSQIPGGGMLGAQAGLGYPNGGPAVGYYGQPGVPHGLSGAGGLPGQPPSQLLGQPGMQGPGQGQQPGQNPLQQGQGQGQGPQGGHMGLNGQPNANGAPQQPGAQPGQQGLGQGQSAGQVPGGAAPGAAGGAPGAQPQQPGQMQQAHAIHYVTKIRNRFSTEPDTYRSFLKILHTYQKEQKGIKEVLEQVSQLFADHPDLLMEFTYFLPDAVQEQAKERLHRAARESEARRIARMQQQQAAKAQEQRGRKNQQQGVGGPGVGPGGMHMTAQGMRGPNGELVPMQNMNMNMMNGMAMMGDGLGGVGPGNKRSRAERDAMRAAAVGNLNMQNMQNMTPAQQQQYAMQLAGMDEATRKNLMANMQAPAYMNMMGQGPPKKVNRRKNGGPPGMMMMPDGSMMAMGSQQDFSNMNANMKNQSQQHQMLLLQQQQQALAHQMQLQQHATQHQQHQRAKESVMSVSAERRYFEQVKEVLSSTSRETWQEFVKVLELFSNDAVSKEDMLDLIADLFGPQHNDLFHEFKRLLGSREEYEEHKSDVWYAVPLSEIDFAQCRKCTPSYRALPRDYPKAKCTERSEEEAKALNDQWVSIPIGSEESYSFKHMRKNQYEEALFKCEDERFEIDMVIDSNMCTIRVLEPLAEEIATLKSVETIPRGTLHGDAATGQSQGAGSSSIAPRFSFQLEKRHLSTIHLNSIARIYGDHGEEILELLRRNPAGTIPVLLKRLKQKDLEWRKARTELNKHWREVVEKNHTRSFDHRSFYFRQHDKKYLSTRQLVTEITTLANPAQATPAAIAEAANAFEDPAASGLYRTVSAESEHLLAGLEPHIVLTYDNDAHLVHRDIYRIMCHAAETTVASSVDKERLAALWRDLLRVFFNVPVHYLYTPQGPAAVPASGAAASEADNASDAGNVPAVPSAAYKLRASDAWPARTRVITTYGPGEVLGYREKDGMYSVKLPFGVAHISPASVYGSEQLNSNALFVIGVTPAEKEGESDVIYNGLVSPSTSAAASAGAVKDPSKLFYGTQMCYIFMRLHHALYHRLRIARQLATEAAQTSRSTEHDPLSHQTSSSANSSKPLYNYFLSQVFSLVEGTIDNARFEEFSRTVLGNKSYVLYTLDKLIAQAVKHLQAMANDENVTKLVGLFVYHHHHTDGGVNGSGGSVDPVLYRDHVACILSHTMEDVFRIQLMASPEAGTSAGISQVGVQHLGILAPPQQALVDEADVVLAAAGGAMDVAEDSSSGGLGSALGGSAALEMPLGVSRASSSASAINASLRARGASLSVPGLEAALTVSGKTPKAVVSDDEEEDRDSENDAERDAEAEDEADAANGMEVNTRQSLYSPSATALRRASMGEFPDK